MRRANIGARHAPLQRRFASLIADDRQLAD
jgi:hypothetical protein